MIAGAGLLAAAATLPPGAAQPIALAAAFGAMYLVVGRVTRRWASPSAPWRAAGLRSFPAWFLAGVLLQLAPHAVAHPGLLAEAADWPRGFASLSVRPAALTLAAVLWEELWFRGPVLNLVTDARRRIAFAVVNGVLFAALHLLNPRFDAAVEGPEVVAAGTLLTLVYFAAGSFYAPLAIHLGNNLASGVLARAVGDANADALDSSGPTTLRTGMLAVACVAASGALLRRSREQRTRAPDDGGRASRPER